MDKGLSTMGENRAPGRPNVILIMVDQMRASASTLYSRYGCRTPNLERLAAAGVTYDKAFTPAPLCVPARVALWTARYPSDTGCQLNNTPMPATVENGVTAFRAGGYQTALIGKNHCFEDAAGKSRFDVLCEISHWGIEKHSECRGLDWWRSNEEIAAGHRIRDHMGVPDGWHDARGMPVHQRTFAYAHSDLPLEDYSTELISRQAVRYVETRDERPFLLWLSYPDPHAPWEAPQSYVDRIFAEGFELPPIDREEFSRPPIGNRPRMPERLRVLKQMVNLEDIDESEVRNLYAAYLAQIRFIDDGIGRLLDCLERTGQRDNTIIVFCSDHGDFMVEHGMSEKGGAMYDCLTHVPLIVSAPRAPGAGTRGRELVSLLDVMPTLLKLAGLPALAMAQGESLPIVAGGGGRQAVFSEYGAGGPPFTLADLNSSPDTFGRRAARATTQRREAEGLLKMVRTSEWKYVYDPMDPVDQLYDLSNDPWELNNLSDSPAHADIVARMQRLLLDWHLQNDRLAPFRKEAAGPR
jgi:arylsulfatase A-like enzyme